MLQVIQYQKTGKMYVEECPKPTLLENGVLVENAFSLVSAGTERSSVETAQASLIGKAKKRPDLVKQVKDNIKREGLLATWEKVKTRLDNYKELGYSCAGKVVESSTEMFKPGDRVAGAGVGYASHAEMVFVPQNLVTKIPENVSYEEAAFTTLGAIALQGVRQADVKIGENVAVIGLGLLGIITIQLLKANGCRVIGLDISEANFQRAAELGCDQCVISSSDSLPLVESFTRGTGTDAVIITAATNSNEPLELALEMARKKSRVVVVGAVGMNIPRNPFYLKELDFRISCSYGPGRYDPSYEEQGQDYPIAYVRWTENRNMQTILDLMASAKLDVKSLITHRIPIKEALTAYDLITGKIKESYLAILIQYPESSKIVNNLIRVHLPKENSQKIHIGFIGAGNFAQSYLIPYLKNCDVNLKAVFTAHPVNTKSVAKKFGFEFCAGDENQIYDSVNTIFIATHHDTYATYVLNGLQQNKNVFVEKPLAVNLDELNNIQKIYYQKAENKAPVLMVGYNRRYSKPFQDIKEFFHKVNEPFVITYRVNAGFIPKEHWVQSPNQGGRIIGEVCHFIDIISFLTQSSVKTVYATSIISDNRKITENDNVSINIECANGSTGNIIYLANGDNSLPKEYCEVFGSGKVAIMNNFDSVSFYNEGKKRIRKYDGSKGHAQEVQQFIQTIKGQQKPAISFDSLYNTTLTTIKILQSLQTKQKIEIEI